MNDFERELRKVVEPIHLDTTYAGRACYVSLGEYNRAKLQFVAMHIASQYDALKMTILNRREGEVDTLVLRFMDLWGKKQTNNPNFKDGVHPHLWDDGGQLQWYVWKPSEKDYKELSGAVNEYLEVFMDQTQTQKTGQGFQMKMK